MDSWTGEIFQLSCTELGQGVHVEAAVLVDETVHRQLVDLVPELLVVTRLVKGSVTARGAPAPLLAVLGLHVPGTSETPAAPAPSTSHPHRIPH